MLQDCRYGFRTLAKNPGFTAVVLASLALGIGANTTTFSWIDGFVLRPIKGVTNGNELVALQTVAPSGELLLSSYPDYRDYRDSSGLLAGIIGSIEYPLTLGSGEDAVPVWAELVTGNFFEVLGVKPVLGRVFLPEEWGERRGGYPVAVLSHHLWQARFHSDAAIVGQTIQLNRQPFTVIGVAPRDFHGAFVGVDWDLWAPLMMHSRLIGGDDWLSERRRRPLQIIARLKPGVALENARAEIDTISQRLARTYPNSNRSLRATLLPVWKAPYTAPSLFGPLTRILMGTAVVVLLIVCANVANLLLARATMRQREFAIRLGLGASRARLIRQLLTESLLLSLAGAMLGVLAAYWMIGSLLALTPSTYFQLSMPGRLDARVLGFTVLLSFAASLLFGLAPALQSANTDLQSALKEGGRGSTSGARSQRLRQILVVSEVSLALVALIGAGLFFRSFQNARHASPGFDPTHVMLASFDLAAGGYDQPRGRAFYRELRRRLEAVPGVEAVSYADSVPLGFEGHSWREIEVDGYAPRPGENMRILRSMVGQGYFELMRIPLVEGRNFTERDDESAPPALIVNQAFVQRFFPGQYPVGRRVRVSGRALTIVGVAANARYEHIDETPQPFMYYPFAQSYHRDDRITVYVRAAGSPENMLPTIRGEVRSLDPNIALFGAMPLVEYIGAALVTQKAAASLLTVLAGLALLLAALGLYSVMAYSISQRTHEIGVRMALGAQRTDVLRLLLREGIVLSLAGCAIGLAGALALTRFASGLLFQVSPTDPPILAGASAFLAAVVLLAAYVPARRAMALDPIASLREE